VIYGKSEGETALIKTIPRFLFSIAVLLFVPYGNGHAETMYVTDQLYLALRKAPGLEQPGFGQIPSDTKVEVVESQGDWVNVQLEDGRTGWVMKKFLVQTLAKAILTENLRKELESKNLLLETLQKENAALRKDASEQSALSSNEPALRKEIEILKSQIAQQKKPIERATKEKAMETLKGIYLTGTGGLLLGLILGYLVGRPRKKRIFC
jgi:SH3 domain protein